MTNDERFQAIFQLYESEHGYAPCRTREVVEWAVGKNLLPMPPPVDPYEVLAGRMSKALAQEFETHEGRRYRVNHAVRATKNGKQQSFWASGQSWASLHMRTWKERLHSVGSTSWRNVCSWTLMSPSTTR